MAKVTLKPGESTNSLIARFKRAVNKDGTLREIKRRAHYMKPSEVRRLAKKERVKALRKAEFERLNPSKAKPERDQQDHY